MVGATQQVIDAPTTVACFVHVPKTAGITVVETLSRHFGASNTFRLPWDEIEPTRVRELLTSAARNHTFLTGHCSASGFDDIQRKHVLTFLRHPVDRVRSLYGYFRTGPRMGHQAIDLSVRLAQLRPFDEFVRSEYPPVAAQVRNGMVRQLSGIVSAGPTEPQWLLRALDRLRSMTVGLEDDMDQSFALLSEALGCDLQAPQERANVTPEWARAQIDAATRDLVCELNTLDMHLYISAKTEFYRLAERLSTRKSLQALLPSQADRYALRKDSGFFEWRAGDPVFALNCYPPEVFTDGNELGELMQFTGPGTRSSFFFRSPAAMPGFTVSIGIAYFVGSAKNPFCEALLAVNGQELKVQKGPLPRTHGDWLTGAFPHSIAEGEILEIELRPMFSMSPQVFKPETSDPRSLGVAVRCIRIVPMSG